MIDQGILAGVRSGICAIGHLTMSEDEIRKDPGASFFQILGTGFLVRDAIAMTNRHVVLALLEKQKKEGFPDEFRYLQFVYPTAHRNWQQKYLRIKRLGVVTNEDLDLGLVEFDGQSDETGDDPFKQCRPLNVVESCFPEVGEDVAVCGYLFGTNLLVRNEKPYRFGPVLQQGHISAVSPLDVADRISELLLDVRVAGGMSGSPVFRPTSGETIGILYATWDATTSVALPVDHAVIDGVLGLRDSGDGKPGRYAAEIEFSKRD